MYFFFKVMITAFLVAGISEVAKRYTMMGAVLASLPLTSLLAFTWIYIETKDTHMIATLSYDILWLILPSLLFFALFPLCLQKEMAFYQAMFLSIVVMLSGYGALWWIKNYFFPT